MSDYTPSWADGPRVDEKTPPEEQYGGGVDFHDDEDEKTPERIPIERNTDDTSNHGEPSAPQVLGRFELPPAAADEVRELLGATKRARDRQTAPSNPRGCSCGSQGESKGQEAENRNTEAGYLRLLRVNGENGTPSLEIGGGEGGHARIGKKRLPGGPQ